MFNSQLLLTKCFAVPIGRSFQFIPVIANECIMSWSGRLNFPTRHFWLIVRFQSGWWFDTETCECSPMVCISTLISPVQPIIANRLWILTCEWKFCSMYCYRSFGFQSMPILSKQAISNPFFTNQSCDLLIREMLLLTFLWFRHVQPCVLNRLLLTHFWPPHLATRWFRIRYC